ncbi:hypothetical protein RhiirA4_469618 [Rhizophagus irregularis]|uniref:Uncharacterized protein n=1 Tax=Rhizophagus irregularis TaxID=588596 RepID=A0A2I1GZU8_9GLOM|nr:hypothetical protein RhiirA4_469618 [Rhizophagus irregularis]
MELTSHPHSTRHLKDPRFYEQQITKMLSKQAKKHKANVKDVHFRDFTYIIVTVWAILKQEHHDNSLKSFLTCGEDPGGYKPTVFKQIQHLPNKYTDIQSTHLCVTTDVSHKQLLRREKNWLRRIKKRNKKRKRLSHPPPGTPGIHAFTTKRLITSISLTTKYVDVSTSVQFLNITVGTNVPYNFDNITYNNGPRYDKMLHQPLILTRIYQISHHDQSIINAPDDFFRRTPPPDNDSHTTVSSDNSSYKSANDHVEA